MGSGVVVAGMEFETVIFEQQRGSFELGSLELMIPACD